MAFDGEACVEAISCRIIHHFLEAACLQNGDQPLRAASMGVRDVPKCPSLLTATDGRIAPAVSGRGKMSGHVASFAALLLACTGTAGCTPEPAASAAEPQAPVQQAGVQQAAVQQVDVQRADVEQAAVLQDTGEHSVFSCRLAGGKIVTVGQEGERFLYRYGTSGQAELTIEGTPANGRVFQQVAVHGGTNHVDLRFVSGAYSYVVHSFPRSDVVDNVPVSGLRVYRGGTMIMDRSCSPWAALSFEGVNSVHDLPRVPEGAPDAWEN